MLGLKALKQRPLVRFCSSLVHAHEGLVELRALLEHLGQDPTRDQQELLHVHPLGQVKELVEAVVAAAGGK